MVWLLNVIFSFLASYFFAVVFDAPKKIFLPAGIAGSLGWLTGEILDEIFNFPQVYSYFFGSLVLGLVCHYLGRVHKEPITMFMIPGIIPFVPGGLSYDAVKKLMLNEVQEPVGIFTDIIMLAGAIAAGLLFAEYFFKISIKERVFIKK
ncbi:threonine/serine exporter family protein [Macrococcus brunensis]|uniref:threonine/serine exporter family protein n=1 Tax=Macrococcus brunensis TaxID=198483 RepID=UPI001EF0F4E1|nr:threonine/serine exporter family protein [Macrococcus brunensis]ULG71982.1 threonine/serine exporter family protein [Macrococcus brunensis]